MGGDWLRAGRRLFHFWSVMSEQDFKIYVPLQFFEKADAPEGARRRVAGLITTERRDREGEVILQRGLDFSEFMNHGWFNDNHAKEADGVLGYPEELKFVRKGERLPDGQLAPADGHWSEGILLNDPRADKVWQKGLALQKAGGKRKLGFSIEGVIQRRAGEDNKIIAKAKVRNVAITHCPVNTDTYLNALEKALEREEDNITQESSDKALTAGASSPSKPVGPVSGAGAGRVITPQSLDHDISDPNRRSLTKAQAVEWFQRKYPNISLQSAARMVDLSYALRDGGHLQEVSK